MDSNLTLTLFFPLHPNLSPFPHTQMLRKKSILVRSSNRFLALPKHLTLLLSFFLGALPSRRKKELHLLEESQGNCVGGGREETKKVLDIEKIRK